MTRATIAFAFAAGLLAAPALAQTAGSAGDPGAVPSGTRAAPGRDVTATGATVPNPGTDKAGPETDRERKAQERSDKVLRSICTGCKP